MLRRLLCALGLHDYAEWCAHEPPCISGAAVHEVRYCQRPGCGGGSFDRRHRFTEYTIADDIASCPGYEATPNPCRCPCYGCKHHCAAHDPENIEETDQP